MLSQKEKELMNKCPPLTDTEQKEIEEIESKMDYSDYPNELDMCPNCKSSGTVSSIVDRQSMQIIGWSCWFCGEKNND